MHKYLQRCVLMLALLFAGVTNALAQVGESPIRIFGYFQTQFNQNDGNPLIDENSNSFLLQQLNIFLQKNLAEDFAALIDIEILNSYSSSRVTGALNLQEAWVRYRAGRHFNAKVGLQIPTFNHLNAIKNRTPVLPYVVRPLVYEESLDQIASIEEFIPNTAFVQAYGTVAVGPITRLDYAVFLGNSPNERTNEDRGQSGLDTTNGFLVGGRVGVRFLSLKAGMSLTHEKVNRFQNLAEVAGLTQADVEGIPRVRIGADLRIALGPATFEGEIIRVNYDEDLPQIDANKTFYYGTLSWLIQDRLTLYASYWITRENRVQLLPGMEGGDILPEGVPDFVSTNRAPSFGLAYTLRDRVVLKGQFTNVSRSINIDRFRAGPSFNTYSLGVSIFF